MVSWRTTFRLFRRVFQVYRANFNRSNARPERRMDIRDKSCSDHANITRTQALNLTLCRVNMESDRSQVCSQSTLSVVVRHNPYELL